MKSTKKIRNIVFIPVSDYFMTRKQIYLKFLVPIIAAAIVLIGAYLLNVNDGTNLCAVINDFVYGQISAIAVLISFSIAIITILVSSNSSNIQALRDTDASKKNYNFLKGKPLKLFQVLLSDITYNVIAEILYLIILIIEIFLQLIIPIQYYKYILAFDVFVLSHILYVLVESIAHMYFTFWTNVKN